MTPIRVTARVKITVEIPCGAWHETETAENITKDAATTAMHKARGVCTDQHWRLIGEPVVTMVMGTQDSLAELAATEKQ